jgi:hypothetical protein
MLCQFLYDALQIPDQMKAGYLIGRKWLAKHAFDRLAARQPMRGGFAVRSVGAVGQATTI